jgi:hypothetical protein
MIQSDDWLNEAMSKRLKAELRIMKATTVAGASAAPPPGEAVARLDGAPGAGLSGRSRCGAGGKENRKTVKAVKWICAVFQSEPAAVQSVPTKTGRGDFTAFALILRLGMGGEGGQKGRIMKAELRNRDRGPNGVVKSAQQQFASMVFCTASQSVAVCRSDVGSKSNLVAAIEPFLASRIPLCV